MDKKSITNKKSRFIKYQKKWNEDNVETGRFYWQTRNRTIAEKEMRLLDAIRKSPGKDVLEVGCGEGANIYNLRNTRKGYTGIDFSCSRIEFAKKNVRGTFAVGDGTSIKLKKSSFDIVFCRDVIHHVWEHEKLIKEMYKVCRPGGRIILIESNALNPVNLVFSLIFRKEHGMRKIYPGYIKRVFNKLKMDKNMSIGYSEAYNLDRLVFHYSMGFPKLSKYSFIRALNQAVNSVFEFITPRIFWAYMIIECRKIERAGEK
jgi:ubiquinone/menaquinone biosynthesis C-methylase UbiE